MKPSSWPIPPRFIATTVALYGKQGRAWLDRLPDLLAEYATRWSIRIAAPFPNLSYNYVAPALRLGGPEDGRAVVVKAGVPNPELLCEIEALRLFAGRGAVRLLEADPAAGIMLLERLRPGRMLVDLADDATATRIAAQVMRKLWRSLPAQHNFPTTAHWAMGLRRLRRRHDGGTGPLPANLVVLAERLFADLLASSDPPVLLHGDLHHENILAADGGAWLAIDPKGLAGEPAYEVGTLLRNPLDLLTWPDLHQVQARRVAILAETLELDRERIVGWAVAQAVLSAAWSLEDHSGWEHAIGCAEILIDLLPR